MPTSKQPQMVTLMAASVNKVLVNHMGADPANLQYLHVYWQIWDIPTNVGWCLVLRREHRSPAWSNHISACSRLVRFFETKLKRCGSSPCKSRIVFREATWQATCWSQASQSVVISSEASTVIKLR